MTTVEAPLPGRTPETEPFWQGLCDGRVLLPWCGACGRCHFYPRALCPHCGGRELQWRPASGRATLYSFTILRRPPPGFGSEPLIVCVGELEEGVRMMATLHGAVADPQRIRCDMPLTIEIVDNPGAQAVVCFRPREPA